MRIKTTYDFKSYAKLLTRLFYREMRGILVVALGVLMLLTGCFFLAVAPFNLRFTFVFLIGGLLLVLLPFFAAKITARRSFFTNKMLMEELVFEFVDDKIRTTGTSFHSEMTWSSLYKVLELKEWFLLYHSKQLFLMIPKDMLGENLSAFRKLIERQEVLNHKIN